jgi:hypothetical protein
MLHCFKLARITTRLSTLVAACCLGNAAVGQSEVIVSSLNNTSSVVNFSIGAWAASSFLTDTQTWTLASATVVLELGAANVSTANVRLFADNAGRPGATLADLGTKTITTGSQWYSFTAPTTVTLSPSSTYWIAVGNVGTNGGLNVALSQQGGSFTNSGVPGASMANSIWTGAGVGTTPPTNWIASAPGMAVLFAVEGSVAGGGGDVPSVSLLVVDAQTAFVTWPTNFTGYSLTASTNLVDGTWMTFTNAPVIRDGQYAQQINPSLDNQFFRLRRP